MKKQILAVLLIMTVVFGSIGFVQAEVISAYGQGQIGLQAVVLCEELTLRESASSSSKALKTLSYGTHIIVTKQTTGWAYCVLGDSENSPAGWVNTDYITIDPAWYRTDAKTSVYAWNSTAAPKVGLLDKNVILPILKIEGDWIVVSLRGAAGWIHK